MKNFLKNKMKDRLSYCKDWKNSVDFLPYNLLRLFRYLRMIHEYEKNQVEIKVLSKELGDYEDFKK